VSLLVLRSRDREPGAVSVESAAGRQLPPSLLAASVLRSGHCSSVEKRRVAAHDW